MTMFIELPHTQTKIRMLVSLDSIESIAPVTDPHDRTEDNHHVRVIYKTGREDVFCVNYKHLRNALTEYDTVIVEETEEEE